MCCIWTLKCENTHKQYAYGLAVQIFLLARMDQGDKNYSVYRVIKNYSIRYT